MAGVKDQIADHDDDDDGASATRGTRRCCSRAGRADTWIEVPTGESFALESEWFYAQDEKDYMQPTNLEGGADLIVAGASGSDHYQTWYFPRH
jgi:hypothetical protein